MTRCWAHVLARHTLIGLPHELVWRFHWIASWACLKVVRVKLITWCCCHACLTLNWVYMGGVHMLGLYGMDGIRWVNQQASLLFSFCLFLHDGKNWSAFLPDRIKWHNLVPQKKAHVFVIYGCRGLFVVTQNFFSYAKPHVKLGWLLPHLLRTRERGGGSSNKHIQNRLWLWPNIWHLGSVPQGQN
jgi:hypothetical protein